MNGSGHRSTEHERIRVLRSILGDSAPGFDVALGDDCAVLASVDVGAEAALAGGVAGHGRLVWSVDSAVEGTHFRRDLMTLEDIGYRSTMAALSDLAAMGARAVGVVGALILPPSLTDDELFALVNGQHQAANETRTAIVGGNLARGDTISITTSVLGFAERPILRSGAHAGDTVYLSGALGFAAVGLHLAGTPNVDDPLARRALAAFRRPRAQLDAGLEAMRAGATAMIDVSDGLAADATHVADASDVTLVLDEERVLSTSSALLRGWLAPTAQRTAIDLALTGGEDYALLATAPEGSVLPGFVAIGRCVSRGAHALVLDSGGEARPITPIGFDHFG